MEAIKMLESELVTLIRNIQSVRSESNRIEIKNDAKGSMKEITKLLSRMIEIYGVRPVFFS